MHPSEVSSCRAVIEPMPENLRSVQPGGGFCYRVELAWSAARRWLLKRLRPGFVRRMAEVRQGSTEGAPHEILDPRDLKYCRNQCTCYWDPVDDPFLWRDALPVTRWGLAELQLIGWTLAALMGAGWWLYRPLAVVPAVPLVLLLWFFRNPRRQIPKGAGEIVCPADGKVAEIIRLADEPFVGGPAVRIGIFLSIFDVHLNRAPAAARVVALRYRPGEFLNALRAESAERNENLWIGLEEEAPPHRRMAVRQIAGAIARRIVCAARTGDSLARGEVFGMIKLGSRTELVLPATAELEVAVAVGQRVRAGSTVVARYARHESAEPVREAAGGGAEEGGHATA